MRITVALSLLAALCTVEAIPASTDLEILRLQVRELKWNADTVTRQLQLLRGQTVDDTIQQVSLKWNEEQDSFRSYKTLLLSGIRKETNAAGAEACYKEAVEGIEDNENLASDEASKCEDNAQDSIDGNLGFIDNLVMTGNELSLELDNVFLNCHDSDILRMQSCIIGELAKIKGDLRTLESDSTSAEITAVPVSKNVIMRASNCLKQAYSSAYSGGVAIRMRVAQCIATPTDPPTDPPTNPPTEPPTNPPTDPPTDTLEIRT